MRPTKPSAPVIRIFITILTWYFYLKFANRPFLFDLENNTERQIVLKPRKLIDPSQGWYWTKEWQKMEADVDGEIEKDHISAKFESAEEGLEWLKE